ncbi:GNAT family N-acetyltransferase [Rhizobiaceae bacterium BDR2-2]|uniref:GNAT family N-acetyltransferase n=1 Tax=Ectorhizobium quercum TaxID=2965071 RepID=A0AAE3MXS6_9HYPH|nr:GNAT family N-acetyltransferase [Ectorhizobium quercum]MCX8996426.1 GNAT family N-acetyltransferase [Ectorhizobium quercum]
MADSSPLIRPMSLSEVETLVEWAGDEGWNPGFADAEAFHAADPEGFIGCFVDGRLAAAIAATAYGREFGFIGLYISHPAFRGKGYGKRVWDAGMERLSGLSVGLDGVPAQQENYRKSGFVEQYRTWRWSGHFIGKYEARDDIVPIAPGQLADLNEYDRRFFPAARPAFLQAWTSAPRLSLAIVTDGRIRGYGTLRQCRDGCKIGPLFVDDDADSQQLFAALASRSGGQMLHIDVPETNTDFSAFLAETGFEKGFVTARMVRGPAPQAPWRTPAGITTLELG